MVASLSVPSPSYGFVKLPNHILLHPHLSLQAKLLYSLLRRYARDKGYCYPGCKRLAQDMRRSERTVRRCMDELVSHGIVTKWRRGLRQTNVYYLASPDKDLSVLSDRTFVSNQERTFVTDKEDKDEKDEGENAVEYSTTFSSSSFHKNDGPPPRSSPPPSKSRYVPQPERDAVIALFGDLRTELRDQAKLGSTSTRALNLWRRSGVTWDDFVDAVYSARTATKARTHAIKSRDEHGAARKMAYFFSLLEDRLGLRTMTVVRERTYHRSYDRVAAYQSQDMATWTGFDAREGKYRRE